MLIAITGKKGAGKDTLAKAFVNQGFMNVKFADPLKGMMRTMYRYAGLSEVDIHRKLEGDLKEVSCPVLGGNTPRKAMQTLGTEWRHTVDHHLWTRIFRDRALDLMQCGEPLVCTDLRFISEANLIKDLGGYILRVHRPGPENTDGHVSEKEMDAIEVDKTIYNVGTIEDLHNKANTYLQEISK